MNSKRIKEEFLEALWHMHERGQTKLDAFRQSLGDDYDEKVVDSLKQESLVSIDGGEIALTPSGQEYARRLVRAHRLAERLIHDVLNTDSESGACEFEHTVSPELVDGICTLLGHPRECPHGMPIPEGECCRQSVTSAESQVVALTQLEVGQSARVAYLQCKSDQLMHKLQDMQIRPGVYVRLHQVYPAFVIECEGASIALDRDVASSIRVLRPALGIVPERRRGRRRFWRGRRGSGRV